MATATKPAPTPTLSLPPRLALILTQLAPTPDPELALRKVLTEYIDLKVAAYQAEVAQFEAKWGMDFAQFAQARADDSLGADPYSYPVESDFWEWEGAHTQLNYYQSLRENLLRYEIEQMERQHRGGYERRPVQPGEFDARETEQIWAEA